LLHRCRPPHLRWSLRTDPDLRPPEGDRCFRQILKVVPTTFPHLQRPSRVRIELRPVAPQTANVVFSSRCDAQQDLKNHPLLFCPKPRAGHTAPLCPCQLASDSAIDAQELAAARALTPVPRVFLRCVLPGFWVADRTHSFRGLFPFPVRRQAIGNDGVLPLLRRYPLGAKDRYISSRPRRP